MCQISSYKVTREILKQIHIVFVLFLCIVTSCQSEHRNLLRAIKSFENSHIIIPEEMIMVQDGEIRQYTVDRSSPKLILYVSQYECSDCTLNHLDDYLKILDWIEADNRFQFMIIISPPTGVAKAIIQEIILQKSPLPIYIDHTLEFASKNNIPRDIRTHCFLTVNDFPVLVGDPSTNKSILILFNQILSSNYE